MYAEKEGLFKRPRLLKPDNHSFNQFLQLISAKMMHSVAKSLEIRQCIFELTVTQAIANIKFPCSFFLQWKTTNSKHSTISNNRVKAIKGSIMFNQQLHLSVLMMYNLKLQHYRKKDSIVLLNLLSNSRPNDPKLVGRVEIDLASVANKNIMSQLALYPLKYCSVDGSISFKVCLRQEKITNIDPNDLERSQCSQSQILGPEFGSLKEDKPSISNSNITTASKGKQKQKVITKTDPQVLLQALNEIKGPIRHQLLGVPEMVPIKLPKKEVKAENNSQNVSINKRSQSNGLDVEQGLEKRLKNDFSIPKLTKNSSQFDSSQINSQRTLKNEVSQKSLSKFVESPKYSEQRHNQFSKKTIQQDKYSEIQAETKKIKQFVNSPQQKKDQATKQPASNSQISLPVTTNDSIKQKQDYQKLKHKYTELQGEIKSKQIKIKELEINLSEKDKIFQQKSYIYIEMKQKTQQELSKYEFKNSQQTKKIKEFDQKIERLQAQNNDLRNIIFNIQEASKVKKNDSQDFPTPEVISELNHRFEIQQKNHQNTKIQLEELRQWYNQLQQQAEQVMAQKLDLQQKNQFFRNSQNNNKGISDNYHQKSKEQATVQLTNRDNEISSLKAKLEEKEKSILLLEIKFNELRQQLSPLKQQLLHQQSFVQSLKQKLQHLNQETQNLKITVQQKQLQVLSLHEELRLTKRSTAQKQREIEKINKNSLKYKEQATLERDNRLKDLISRLKDKQDSIAKFQRQKQQLQSKLKQAQFGSQQYKEKLKKVEDQKLRSDQKFKLIERQNKDLKKDVQKLNSKIQNDTDSFNRTVGKLRQNMDQQIQRRKQMQKNLRQQESSKQNQRDILKDYQERITGYIDRQSVLKENIQIVEAQISKIADLLTEKEENEEYFNQAIISLNHMNTELTIRNSELQNQLKVSKERCQALEAEVQLLNAYMPDQQDETQLLEMNRKLNIKNKQLLEIIQQKDRQLTLFEKNQGQNKLNQARKDLANSRQLKQRSELDNKLLVLEEQNFKAYKQLEKLNVKYEEQLNLLQASNQEKTKQLLSTIQHLNKRVKSLQSKDLDTYNQSKLIKEELLKVQQGLNEKQFQLEIYNNQIKEKNETIEGLQSQLNVLNTQYQNVYSQMGEKEFQLYQANAKVKELQQSLQAKSNITSNHTSNNGDYVSEYKQKLELYEAKIQEIERTEQHREKENQNLRREAIELKAKIQLLVYQLNQKGLQLEKYKSDEEKINQIQDQQKTITSHFQAMEYQLSNEIEKLKQEKEKLLKNIETLQIQNSELKAEAANIKQNQSALKEESSKQLIKESQPSTPIQYFKDSSSLQVSNCNEKVNLKELVEQLTLVINKRKDQQEVQGVLRLVIDNNARQEQQFERWNRERGTMQQKAKLASKQLQKAKSAIMKNTTRSIAQKSQITGLLKPIQSVIGQLINLSQTLSELDLDMEQQDGQMQIGQKQGVKV